ncbi:DUF3298 and DUF4163 domain-containing protein [Anaeromicrobium sediminis]|uniref:DUF3298 domain-containing protein n=1 Tax=Anaeromicrobium sediminis TaxID=1478221 RepID=A0A267MMR0_9FIRM|nr:DUF3298 and DUF4163 domain-containing protein [Anaeromicrobium sediminis]PAB60826.1 hypothetical protein CCE28_04640 [Anaeromicrobium sediminis]
MDKKLNELNKIYENIQIPKNLDDVIDKAIKRKKDNKVIKMKRFDKKIYKRVGTMAASLVIVFGLTVNSSAVLAQEIYKIPVIGNLAKMVTFREYNIDNETSKGNVKIPTVSDVENKEIENQINETIQKKVDEIVKEQAILDKEYKEAYLATGGKEEEYRKVEMTVDYKLHYSSENIISFEISKYQTLAPAYNEVYFYNTDLETGKDITIKDVLGDNYAKMIKEKVEKQMIDRVKENPDLKYDLDYFKDMEIKEDRKFYVQENGEIVIFFDKYEVASGVMGPQNFVVGNLEKE